MASENNNVTAIYTVMPSFFGLGKSYLWVSQWEIPSKWSRKS